MKSFLLLVAIVFIGSSIAIAMQIGFSSSVLIVIGSVVASLVVVAILDWWAQKVRF